MAAPAAASTGASPLKTNPELDAALATMAENYTTDPAFSEADGQRRPWVVKVCEICMRLHRTDLHALCGDAEALCTELEADRALHEAWARLLLHWRMDLLLTAGLRAQRIESSALRDSCKAAAVLQQMCLGFSASPGMHASPLHAEAASEFWSRAFPSIAVMLAYCIAGPVHLQLELVSAGFLHTLQSQLRRNNALTAEEVRKIAGSGILDVLLPLFSLPPH